MDSICPRPVLRIVTRPNGSSLRIAGKAAENVQFLPSTHRPTAVCGLDNSGVETNSLAQRIEALSLIAAVFDPDLARIMHQCLGTTPCIDSSAHRRDADPKSSIIHRTTGTPLRLQSAPFQPALRKHFGASARARQTEPAS